jgi:deazaflavin-dependent oxidoreductase (nitroreductase family)
LNTFREQAGSWRKESTQEVRIMNQMDHHRQLIEEFRAHAGQVGGRFVQAPLLLLTTIGRRSRRQRTTPLRYLRDGERLVVFAANAGAPRHPGWYHNLLAHSQVTLEVGTETFEARAYIIEGAERERLLAQQAAVYPHFAEYQARTTRQIPAVAFERMLPGAVV